VCTYNRKKTIVKCIDSILNQTIDDLEIIVIDDGSTDNTIKILNSRYKNNISFYKNITNKGLIFSRNKAIKLSSGNFISFVDSDDWILPNHFKIRKKILKKNNCDFVHGGFKVLGKNYVVDRFDETKKISLSDCIVDSTLIFKKKDLTNLGLFPNIDYGAGYDLYYNAKKKGLKCCEIEEKTYIYDRTNLNSITNKKLENLIN
tara:strand:- start:8368 stop:8976 length:609 start_codon:yes stop_codon:yes gene_type:complete